MVKLVVIAVPGHFRRSAQIVPFDSERAVPANSSRGPMLSAAKVDLAELDLELLGIWVVDGIGYQGLQQGKRIIQIGNSLLQ